MFEHKKNRLYFWGAALFIWAVWISGVFGNAGVLQAYKLSQARRDVGLKIKALENERMRLKSSLYAMEKDAYTQETTIRESLGFVHENEIVFEFK